MYIITKTFFSMEGRIIVRNLYMLYVYVYGISIMDNSSDSILEMKMLQKYIYIYLENNMKEFSNKQ